MTLSRREFVKKSSLLATPLILPKTSWSELSSTASNIRVAVIGVGGKGTAHVRDFSQIKGVTVAAVCDADTAHMDKALAKYKEDTGNDIKGIKKYQDYRKLLEDKDIDAVIIATQNHWHTLMSIWACQAGKDVYVEKPVSHNILEGQLVTKAAEKYNRLVMHGTQNRSREELYEAMEFVNQGNLGEVKLVRTICYRRRKTMGKVEGTGVIPSTVDYDLFTGPAPLEPLKRINMHYDWHWQWAMGNGEIGNQAIHELDKSRWFAGHKTAAPRVISVGGRFGYDDDGQTPNNHIIYYDYDKVPIIAEVRALSQHLRVEVRPVYLQQRVSAIIHCEGGTVVEDRVYDEDGKQMKRFERRGNHHEHFIDVLRSQKFEQSRAPMLQAHRSCTLIHQANISHRLGQKADPMETIERVSDKPAMIEAFGRMSEHLRNNGVDILQDHSTLGAALEFDTKTEKFTGSYADEANQMHGRDYRAGYDPRKV